MLRFIFCIVIGYLLGSLSPSAFFAKLKKQNLREQGSGNLGATNAFLIIGKKYGIIVMLFDVLKAYLSITIAKLLFPKYIIIGILTGCVTILGHIFPFYMNFSGGKGVASLAGLLLAIVPNSFLILLLICLTLMIVFNYVVAAPVSASTLAPFVVGLRMRSFGAFFFLAIIGIVIIAKHKTNFIRIKNGTEVKVSEYFKKDSQVNS